jgi:hypothetical protein
MIFSGLKLCDNCGVYEFRRIIKYKQNRNVHMDIWYWSSLPKYGLKKKPCPSCKPEQDYFKVSRYYG